MLDNLLSRGICLLVFFGHFFDEWFLNKGGGSLSGALKLPKICVLGLKIRHFDGRLMADTVLGDFLRLVSIANTEKKILSKVKPSP